MQPNRNENTRIKARVISLLLMTLSFSWPTFGYATDKTDNNLTTLITIKALNIATKLDDENRDDLTKNIQAEWKKRGLPENQVRFCEMKTCTEEAYTSHTLEVIVAAIEVGNLTQGFSISFEQSDPRQAHNHEEQVLPIQCLVRSADSKTLLQRNKWNAPVPENLNETTALNTSHLAKILVEACEKSVYNTALLNMDNQAPHEYATSYENITVQKKVVNELGAGEVTEKLVSVVQNDAPLHTTEQNRTEKRTQYIIKNPASEVILEFGQQR